MTPGAAAGSAPHAGGRPLRIALGRPCIVVLVEPVGAPLVDVLADVINAERVRRSLADAHWTRNLARPAVNVLRPLLRRLIAPRVTRVFAAPSRRPLPFGFGGQAVPGAGLPAEPFTVLCGLKPAYGDNRLFGIVKNRVIPMRRGRVAGGIEE